MSILTKEIQDTKDILINYHNVFKENRSDVINEFILTQEIQNNIFNVLSGIQTVYNGTNYNLFDICLNLSKQRALLLGYSTSDVDYIDYGSYDDFNSSSIDGLVLPTNSRISVIIKKELLNTANSSNILTLSTNSNDDNYFGNFYLVRSRETGELVDYLDDSEPYDDYTIDDLGSNLIFNQKNPNGTDKWFNKYAFVNLSSYTVQSSGTDSELTILTFDDTLVLGSNVNHILIPPKLNGIYPLKSHKDTNTTTSHTLYAYCEVVCVGLVSNTSFSIIGNDYGDYSNDIPESILKTTNQNLLKKMGFFDFENSPSELIINSNPDLLSTPELPFNNSLKPLVYNSDDNDHKNYQAREGSSTGDFLKITDLFAGRYTHVVNDDSGQEVKFCVDQASKIFFHVNNIQVNSLADSDGFILSNTEPSNEVTDLLGSKINTVYNLSQGSSIPVSDNADYGDFITASKNWNIFDDVLNENFKEELTADQNIISQITTTSSITPSIQEFIDEVNGDKSGYGLTLNIDWYVAVENYTYSGTKYPFLIVHYVIEEELVGADSYTSQGYTTQTITPPSGPPYVLYTHNMLLQNVTKKFVLNSESLYSTYINNVIIAFYNSTSGDSNVVRSKINSIRSLSDFRDPFSHGGVTFSTEDQTFDDYVVSLDTHLDTMFSGITGTPGQTGDYTINRTITNSLAKWVNDNIGFTNSNLSSIGRSSSITWYNSTYGSSFRTALTNFKNYRQTRINQITNRIGSVVYKKFSNTSVINNPDYYNDNTIYTYKTTYDGNTPLTGVTASNGVTDYPMIKVSHIPSSNTTSSGVYPYGKKLYDIANIAIGAGQNIYSKPFLNFLNLNDNIDNIKTLRTKYEILNGRPRPIGY